MQKLHTINDTCRILSVSRATVYRLISDQQLLTVKVRGRTLVRATCIDTIAGVAA
ncbi:helix-turn-helix domain-containing protein [Sphingomonas aracearum]|uniref:DNA-binding protein n=1 Tax=Sphingomonas aracearum TaxID=2283317 RepID=A0A369VU23_9SPHN|nr:helix-turn-helix domain-containing protein [Sphingomonas aracearum]RDE05583.1 DNA-binding protein [Sphingomonas aracearum]